jgi:hypothetical protein
VTPAGAVPSLLALVDVLLAQLRLLLWLMLLTLQFATSRSLFRLDIHVTFFFSSS